MWKCEKCDQEFEIVQRWVDVEMPNIAKGQKVAGVRPSQPGDVFEVSLSDKEVAE